MKKLLIGTNILTLALLLFLWSSGCRTGGNPRFCKTPSCAATCFPFDTTAPFTGLDKRLAVSLVDNYRKHQWTASRNGPAVGLEDARAVWFSLPRLKQFIYQIEKNACKSCIKNDQPLGIRAYFGAYPGTTDPVWMSNNLTAVLHGTYPAHRETVVMVATYNHNGIDEDFDPSKMNANPCKPLLMSQIFDHNVDSSTYFMAFVPGLYGNTPTADMMNHGQQDPPGYDGRFDPPLNSAGVNTSNISCNGDGFMNWVDQVSPPCH